MVFTARSLIPISIGLWTLLAWHTEGVKLMSNTSGELLSNSISVACPNHSISFTCISSAGFLTWELVPPPSASVNMTVFRTFSFSAQLGVVIPTGRTGFMFETILTNSISDNFTSVLTTVTSVAQLNGTTVLCSVVQETMQLLIKVIDTPSCPLNPRLSATTNQPSSSIVTVEWDPPSSPGGVSVSYVLTISPPPLSQSPLTVETTSTQITVSYNTQYNLTIRADNCAGMSQDNPTLQFTVCPSPTPASGVAINSVPSVSVEGSTLNFTCTLTGESVVSTCGRDGQWSPDPETFDCSAISCRTPGSPYMGSVDNEGLSSFSLGSNVTYQCDSGLFPNDIQVSTCHEVMGRGLWVQNPADLVCREKPVSCTLPLPPVNGSIVDCERLNRTVVEGTVLTYQCDSGLSLTGPTTITCTSTNDGQWSTDPGTITCVIPATPAMNTLFPLSTGAAVGVSVAVSAVVFTILGFLAGVLVTCLVTRKKAVYSTAGGQVNIQPTVPVDPVYEDVSPSSKEEIELNINQAYGPVGQ